MMPDIEGNAAIEYGEMHERRVRAKELSATLMAPAQDCASCGRRRPAAKMRQLGYGQYARYVCDKKCAHQLCVGPRDRSARVALPPVEEDDEDDNDNKDK